MDAVVFWKDIVCKFNEEKRCGFCWRFYAPLTEIDLNLVKKRKRCCVNVFLVWNGAQDFAAQPNFDVEKGLPNNPIETFSYQVYFLISSKEGINNYNEMPEHPISESRYETILKPLRKCINYDILNEFCLDFGVTSWTGNYVYDYQDEMYYGIRLNIVTQRRL